MSKFTDLQSFVTELEKDFAAFYDKGNKAAGTRIRGKMQELKTMAQEIRTDIQAKKTGDA